MSKANFDIDEVMARVQKAVQPFPKAALFDLAEEGYTSPFEILVACMISIRTRDEVTLPTARQLFERARTPKEIVELDEAMIDELIGSCSFHERKARQIHTLAGRIVEEYNGRSPCTAEELTDFSGVGVKCANLVLGIACDQPRVSVDVHVHRVTNRWGYVETGSPETTNQVLEGKLPKKYWVTINRILVPFGKHICTGRRPYCSTCPVLEMCAQAGVKDPR